LLLATGELVRVLGRVRFQADQLEQLCGALLAAGAGDVTQAQAELDFCERV
jgi:hypothetical protein